MCSPSPAHLLLCYFHGWFSWSWPSSRSSSSASTAESSEHDYLSCRPADNRSKVLKLQQFSISNFRCRQPVRLGYAWSGSEDRRPALRDGGKSELQRAAGWITSRRGNATDSATESKPPNWSRSAGPEARVKRCGKSAPRPARAATAWQTPCGARPNREAMEPPVSVTQLPGRLLD